MIFDEDFTYNMRAVNFSLSNLKRCFPHCFDRDGNFDFSKFRSELDNSEINISKEGYSLDWLGKSYARFLSSDSATTLLKEDEEHNSKPENINSQNLLIKGDNLEVLKHLSNAYCEKVKMIYIDPPYNTGSDGFVYNDDRKFTVEQLQELIGISEERAQRILEFTQSRSNSHSAWLTFMYPRLYISRQLLKDDGVIFVSIDDNEVAQLRLLMDEVFGEENFIEELIWKSKSGGANDSRFFANDHEYIICYAKDSQKLSLDLDKNAKISTSYNLEDGKGKYALDRLDKQSLGYLKSLDFPIIAPDGTEYKIFHKDPKNKVARWRWGKETIKKDMTN